MKKSLLLILLAAFTVTAGELPSVKDFGAKGDGKTDDTEALQKAVDTVAKKVSRYGSGTLYFPKGTDTLYCFPYGEDFAVTKIALATEELYDDYVKKNQVKKKTEE